MKKEQEKLWRLTIKPSRTYKMTEDEVQQLLHTKRKGGNVKPSKKAYVRREKHKGKNDKF